MKHLHLTRVLAFALALVLLLGCTACGKKTTDDTGDTVGQKDTQTTVELDGKFTLNYSASAGMNPYKTQNSDNLAVCGLVYETLTEHTDAFAAAAGPAAVQRACLPDNTPEHYRAFARRCAARRIRILPYDDPDYPLAFSRISDMPLVLYCTGDPRWLNEPAAVGMVGTRKPTEYGLRAAEDIGRGLARAGAVIVSGLADGLDSAGHRAAVGENCPTIAVMGVPIDRTYPAANRELRRAIERRGCVISEYPPESEPVGAVGFLQRNRLIAALSGALVVVEAKEKSGTMSTVGHAEQYGKPVFAVPGSIFSPASAGTNALLRMP